MKRDEKRAKKTPGTLGAVANALQDAFFGIGTAMRSIQDAVAKRIRAARAVGGTIPTSDVKAQRERARLKRFRKCRQRVNWEVSGGDFYLERMKAARAPVTHRQPPDATCRGANRAERRRANVEGRRRQEAESASIKRAALVRRRGMIG